MLRKFIIGFVIVAFIGLCAGVTFFLYLKNKKSPELIVTEKPQYRDIVVKTVATGIIEPRRENNVKPQISGIIHKILKKPGDMVQQGEVIAQIRIIPNMNRIQDAESSVRTANIQYETALKDYERQKNLYDDKIISYAEFLQTEQNFLVRKEQKEAAENNLQLALKGSSNRVKQTTTEIKATISGKILDIPIKEGSMVIESNTFNEGTTVAVLANMQDLIFKGKVVESEVSKLKEGLLLKLHVGALPADTFLARLEFVATKGTEDKGTVQFEIKAGIIQGKANANLKSGYSASADIILEQKEKVLSLSEKCLRTGLDSIYIWVQTAPGIFYKKLIKRGISDDTYFELLTPMDTFSVVKVP